MFLFFRVLNDNGEDIEPQLIGFSKSRKQFSGLGFKRDDRIISSIVVKETKLSMANLYELQKQHGVSPSDFDWTDINNPTVSQSKIDAKLWKNKKRKMKAAIKKYALNNSVPTRIEKVIMLNLWGELTEAEWRQIEVIYDSYTA